MSRIECEAAAQCAQIEEAVMGIMEPAITVSAIAVVAFGVGWRAYRMVKADA